MKKLVAMAAIAAILVLPLATEAAKDPNKKKNNTPTPISIPTDLKGAIVKVEGNEVTVTIKITTDLGTRVVINNESKAVSDLKPGDAVTVTTDRGSVSKIEIAAPPASASAPAPATK